MAITYHAGRRIQGIAGTDEADTHTSTATPSGTYSITLGGGSGSGATRCGLQVHTGHFLIDKGLKTIKFNMDRYGSVSGTGHAQVYDSSGNTKGSTSSTYSLSGLPAYPVSTNGVTFTWTTPVVIANGDRIMVEGGSFNTSNQVDFWSLNSDADSNINPIGYNSGTWTAQSGVDTYFVATTETNNGDTKPANVQAGSRFEETDTRKMYHYEAGDPTYETDFSTNTGWTTSSSSLVDISTANNELQVKENGGTLAQMYYDLGASVSTTKWVIRCRILVNGNANTDEVLFKLELNDTSNASSNTNSDALGFYVYTDRNNTWSRIYQVCKDNTTSVQGLSATPAYYGNISSSTYYYITLTRSSATDFEVKIRTGSHSGTVLGTLTQTSIPSGLTGLRYLTAQNYLQGQGQTMDISEVEFYNGVTTPVMPNTWKELGT